MKSRTMRQPVDSFEQAMKPPLSQNSASREGSRQVLSEDTLEFNEPVVMTYDDRTFEPPINLELNDRKR